MMNEELCDAAEETFSTPTKTLEARKELTIVTLLSENVNNLVPRNCKSNDRTSSANYILAAPV